MMIMQLTGISKYFGADQVLENVKLEIKQKDRIAIVGRNGSGKSTLLKIIAGISSYDTGDIYKRKDVTIGYLSQHTGLESEKTIFDEMLSVFQPLLDMEKELRQLEQQMSEAGSRTNHILSIYDQLQEAFKQKGGYHYEAEIRSVLNGLHFQSYDDDTPIQQLSGGQKTRLALGKLLLKKPELLILDEPTNHLDIDTLAWLESYLTGYPGAIVIVSHDRYFLDKTVNIVYEISRKKITKYHGTYSKYLTLRKKDLEIAQKEYEKQQTEIKEMEDFIQKNIVRASTTKRAQSRRKQLDKMEKIDRPLASEASASFSFQVNKKSGNDVLKIRNLSFQYDNTAETLFKDINIEVNRGDRIAIVGPNGVGKSTLLKLIIGHLKPHNGSIDFGTNVQIGYYDQELQNLSKNKTVLQELWDEYPTINEKDIRTTLGNFLFSGDDVLKPVQTLSGGEKARLSLAKLHMQKANLLILDEPTNHLDIDSKEVLEEALLQYEGSIVFVSHDRYFINKITTQVIEIEKNHAAIYLGDYDYYVEKKQEQAEIEALNQEQKKVKTIQERPKHSFQEEKKRQSEIRTLKRRIQEIEEKLEKLEAKEQSLQYQMTEPEVYLDHEKANALLIEINKIKELMHDLMEEWEELEEKIITLS